VRSLMSFRVLRLAALVCLTGAVGCGGSSGPKLPTPVKVKGVVALDSQPLSNAMVFFVPDGGKNMGNGATGITDASGNFELVTVVGANKKPGVIPGNYRVSISRLVGPDGTAVTPMADVAPANMGAVESLPPRYSDSMMSELKANVTGEGNSFEFSITSR